MVGGSVVRRVASDGLWAITSYFNPMRSRRRRANYEVFREHLTVPLVTVELGYAPAFELGEGDAEVLVQVRGGDVMWQKERLLNLALASLPGDSRKVAWLDCDLVFESSDWAERLSRALDRYALVHAFMRGHYMPADLPTEHFHPSLAEHTRLSMGAALAAGIGAMESLEAADPGANQSRYTPGFAWAARREALERHGFYDACIVGSGDRALAAAQFGCFHHAIGRLYMHERAAERYRDWAGKVFAMFRGDAGSIEGDVFHLWHGSTGNRRSYQRHADFRRFAFDPSDDIAIDANGCWRWSSEKPDMHRYVREYFASRREDG